MRKLEIKYNIVLNILCFDYNGIHINCNWIRDDVKTYNFHYERALVCRVDKNKFNLMFKDKICEQLWKEYREVRVSQILSETTLRRLKSEMDKEG